MRLVLDLKLRWSGMYTLPGKIIITNWCFLFTVGYLGVIVAQWLKVATLTKSFSKNFSDFLYDEDKNISFK